MASASKKLNDIQVKKVRIRAIAAVQKEQFIKVVQSTFTEVSIDGENSYVKFEETVKSVNTLIGWQL